MQNIGSHNRRTNQSTTGERLDQRRILEVVKNFLNSFHSLEFAQLLRVNVQQIGVHLKAGRINSHLKGTLHILLTDAEAVLEQNRGQVVAVNAVVDGLQSFTDKILQVDQQGVDEPVFVGFEAFFLKDVQDLIGSNGVIFHLCDHIGVLCKVSDRFGRNFSRKLDVYDFFFLNDKTTRISNDRIQRNNRVFDGFHPSQVDLLINKAVRIRNFTVSALGFIHKLGIEILTLDKRDKILGIYIIHQFKIKFHFISPYFSSKSIRTVSAVWQDMPWIQAYFPCRTAR